MAGRKVRLLAAASGGGHWIQLLRLRGAFADADVAYVSMFENYAEAVPGARFYTVPDASRFDKKSFAVVFAKALYIMMKERPSVVVTTGSAPMLMFVVIGRMIGARTLWIDSIANSEKMSSSGRLARKLASRVVSQWPDVAEKEHVGYWGSVL